MRELMAEFMAEARELILRAGEDLVALEHHPTDSALIDSAFRAVHTLKGSVALFELAPVERVLHAAEDLLSALRSGTVPVGEPCLTVLLACVDQVEGCIDTFAKSGGLPADVEAMSARLMARLQGVMPGGPGVAEAAAEPVATESFDAADGWGAEAVARLVPGAGTPLVAVRYVPDSNAYFSGDDPLAIAAATPGLCGLDVTLTEAPDAGEYDPFFCRLCITLVADAPEAAVRAAFRLFADQVTIATIPAPNPPERPSEARSDVGAATLLRVDPARVDQLAALLDELVQAQTTLAGLTRNPGLALHSNALGEDGTAELRGRVRDSAAGIGRLAAALQRGVLALRLQPLDSVFRRLPRIIRDAAHQSGKQVDLIASGQDVEADKAMVDALYEPLLHLVRNGVDHGVELPEVRVRAGKPAGATISLHASRRGENLAITVSDDGRGMDPAQLRAAASRRGLLSPAQLDALTDEAALALVFEPGFSTAAAVGPLSGRGVGMDAVRTAVAGLGGRVSLGSEPGKGTRVTLLLPASVSLTRVMLIACGHQRFGIPVDSVLAVIRVAPGDIMPVRHCQAVMHRGRPAPLLSLTGLLSDDGAGGGGIERSSEAGFKAAKLALVVDCAGTATAILIDTVLDRVDAVLRPMTGLLIGAPGLAGTTMVDGQLTMVLDLPALVATVLMDTAP